MVWVADRRARGGARTRGHRRCASGGGVAHLVRARVPGTAGAAGAGGGAGRLRAFAAAARCGLRPCGRRGGDAGGDRPCRRGGRPDAAGGVGAARAGRRGMARRAAAAMAGAWPIPLPRPDRPAVLLAGRARGRGDRRLRPGTGGRADRRLARSGRNRLWAGGAGEDSSPGRAAQPRRDQPLRLHPHAGDGATAAGAAAGQPGAGGRARPVRRLRRGVARLVAAGGA